jgi:hypothetical protein
MTDLGKPLSDNIIVWTNEEDRVIITQMIDDDVDMDADIARIQSSHPELTFRFKAKMSETGVAVNYFYGALVLDADDNIAYDMVKARAIWKDMMRQLREPKFQELDLQYQLAIESGNTVAQAEIIANKTILRDCTANPDIDAATSLNDLRRTLPELLAD